MRRHRRSRRKASLTERARCYPCLGGTAPRPCSPGLLLPFFRLIIGGRSALLRFLADQSDLPERSLTAPRGQRGTPPDLASPHQISSSSRPRLRRPVSSPRRHARHPGLRPGRRGSRRAPRQRGARCVPGDRPARARFRSAAGGLSAIAMGARAAVLQVRIHLPPAESQVRTCLSREFAFLRREATVSRGCAGWGERP